MILDGLLEAGADGWKLNENKFAHIGSIRCLEIDQFLIHEFTYVNDCILPQQPHY